MVQKATFSNPRAPSPLRLPESAPSSPQPPGQLNILLHNSDSLRVNGAKIGVFEEMHKERLGGFL